ncbi:PAS domain S-box protein [Desulfosarcina sp.]|uniref:PAS domain-containing sensor histidine kinase n=1 Tax=Desulfosarcina sp. TaxID=2027861 RepID=UPI0029A6E611|nr:PAS domain S-box protein [Desulfosarcina sp.]MDX2453032.1 PAS domain S-box protein [Desulfosarcina sp.]MDX2490764.1 PAS domain S-box protein [Desulfosarcina sp.]
MDVTQAHGLTGVLDAMADGIYIVNDDYVVEFMNKAMIRVFGDGVGKKCHEVINHTAAPCPWCRAPEVFENRRNTHEEVYVPMVDKTYDLLEIPLHNTDGSISKLSLYRDITHRKDQEYRLKTSRESFRSLFEHMAAGVYISSKEGKFLDANPALLDMMGYEDRNEFLDMDLARDIYLEADDRARFQQMIEKNGRVVDYEVDFRKKDGTPIPVLLTAHVRYDPKGNVLGYEGICVDQSQRKKMEKELKKAHDFLNNIIQSSPNAIMGTDMKGNIIIWNQGAEETLGYQASETIGGMNVRDLYPGDMARQVMRMMRSDDYGGKGKLRSYPMTFKGKYGRPVEGNLSANIIYDEAGREIASVGIFVDLEEQLKMERKLHNTQEQLLQSEKLAAMGRLTSQIAHELNNPLYGIMNTLELMKTEIPVGNKRRKLLEMSLSETVRVTDMLRKMLSFSKPDQEERAPVDINTILDEILLLYEKQLWEHSIKMVHSFADKLGLVHASKNQLRQVFLNLISNARDAMPDGGRLTVATEGDDYFVHITIADDGAGIKEEYLDLIFETFFTTKTDSVKGVGLGLSVCYGFIKDHGGDIKVESQLGEGTTFSISLPVHRQSD